MSNFRHCAFAQSCQNLCRHFFTPIANLADRPHARRTSRFAPATSNQFDGLAEKPVAQPIQRCAQPYPARVIVVKIKVRLPRGDTPRNILGQRNAEIARIAHQ